MFDYGYIVRFPDEDWNWQRVSGSKVITMSDIESHLNLPWNWGTLVIILI